MEKRKFEEVGLNVATNHREASSEEILVAMAVAGRAISPKELAAMSGYPLTTVKKCLNILKREALVEKHRDGLRFYYSLRGKQK